MMRLVFLFSLLPCVLFGQLGSGYGREVLKPSDVDSLFYWFDASDAATITTTNNKVTGWADKSGNSYDVAQADTSKAPTYSATAGPNGNTPAMVFDGTDDYLSSASHWWGSDDLTVFVVMKNANATRDAYEFITGKSEAVGNLRQWYIQGTNTVDSYFLRGVMSSDGTTTGRVVWIPLNNTKSELWSLQIFHSTGTDADWYKNGIEQLASSDVATTIFNNSQPLMVGAENITSTPSAFLQGSISEILVFSRALSSSERQGIEAYLSAKWNLPLENKPAPQAHIRRIPPNYIDSLFYWFDAEDASTITTNNNKVTSWADKSGNGYDVVQADTSKAPTYSATSGPGGTTAALTFDGTDDYLASAAHFWGSDDITIFVVMKFADATRDASEIILSRSYTTANERQFLFYGIDAANSYAIWQRNYKDGGSVNYSIYAFDSKNESYRLYSASVLSGSCTARIDGENKTVSETNGGSGDGTIYNSSNNPLEIGASSSRGTPFGFLQGSISEIIVFSRALTPLERRGVEAYLNDKYNLW